MKSGPLKILKSTLRVEGGGSVRLYRAEIEVLHCASYNKYMIWYGIYGSELYSSVIAWFMWITFNAT